MRIFFRNLCRFSLQDRQALSWVVTQYAYLLSRMKKLEKRMSVYDDVLVELSQATDNVSAELDDLRNQLASNDLSSEEAAEKLTPLVDRLKAMGTNGTVDPNAGVDPTTTTDPTNSPATDPTQIEVNDSGDVVDHSADES